MNTQTFENQSNVLNYGDVKPKTVLSITSGKGGVGKTLTTVNIAMAARKMGYRVLILDGDLGLANVDVVLGLRARYNIRDVLDGHVDLKDIIVEGPLGIQLIPTGSGIASLSQLTLVQKNYIQEQLKSLEDSFDLLIIDTGAGISDNVIHLNKSAHKTLVVTTPEPHAITDAYALIKVLAQEGIDNELSLVVNMTKSADEGVLVHSRIADVTSRFIGKDIKYMGSIPMDPQVSRAVLLRSAVSETSCQTLAGQAWNRIARSLLEDKTSWKAANSEKNFWQSLLWSETKEREPMIAGAF